MVSFCHQSLTSYQLFHFLKQWITILIILCVNRVFCNSCYSVFNAISENLLNKRFVGKMMASKDAIGPQMCLSECAKRNCESVNYNIKTFECELNSQLILDESEASIQDDPDYLLMNASDIRATNQIMELQSTKMNQTQDKNYVCTTLKSKEIKCVEDIQPRDCKDLLIHGSMSSGVYTLYPIKDVVIRAYCDMTTDTGGWTAFQRRTSGSVDFFRSWDDYKKGFGDINGNHWLGNDYLHLLLSNGESEMRMDMEDFNGSIGYIQYSSFAVGNEASDYQATLQGPSGNVSDCLTTTSQRLNSTRFVTKDRDVNNCANRYKGGWWYVSCHCTNPNGLYLSGQTSIYAEGMVYYQWLGHHYSLKSFSMMIRRKS